MTTELIPPPPTLQTQIFCCECQRTVIYEAPIDRIYAVYEQYSEMMCEGCKRIKAPRW